MPKLDFSHMPAWTSCVFGREGGGWREGADDVHVNAADVYIAFLLLL